MRGRLQRTMMIAVLCAVTGGCAVPVKLTPRQGDGQKIVYQDGRPALLSQKQHMVMVAPRDSYFNSSGRTHFIVVANNRSRSDEILSTNNIGLRYKIMAYPKSAAEKKATAGSFDLLGIFGMSDTPAVPAESASKAAPSGPLEPRVVESGTLKVFSYDDLVREEQRRQAVRAFAAALGGLGRSMEAANAGYTNTSGTFMGNYNSYSVGGPSGTYMGT